MNALAAPRPRNYAILFNTILVNPKDKADRNVGMTTRQLCEYDGICTAGCNQLLRCYRNVDMWLLPEHFSLLCCFCQNAVKKAEPVFPEAQALGAISIEDPKAYVYFISDGEYIKIGKAVDPYRRLAEIQTGNPRKCSITSMIPCSSSSAAHRLEHLLHVHYKAKRTVGEWFDVKSDMDIERFQTAYPPRKEEDDAADIP